MSWARDALLKNSSASVQDVNRHVAKSGSSPLSNLLVYSSSAK